MEEWNTIHEKDLLKCHNLNINDGFCQEESFSPHLFCKAQVSQKHRMGI